MATDFSDGKTFPRRGRDAIGGFTWLARVSDKARAAAAGTIADYIYPCPMDLGVFERWGISVADFDAAIAKNATDDELFAWLATQVNDEGRKSANTWVLQDKAASLDRQDREEGVA